MRPCCVPSQDPGNFTVFNGESSWTAKEDVRLLDAIEQYGYGNWVDIAKPIERRTPDGQSPRAGLAGSRTRRVGGGGGGWESEAVDRGVGECCYWRRRRAAGMEEYQNRL